MNGREILVASARDVEPAIDHRVRVLSSCGTLAAMGTLRGYRTQPKPNQQRGWFDLVLVFDGHQIVTDPNPVSPIRIQIID